MGVVNLLRFLFTRLKFEIRDNKRFDSVLVCDYYAREKEEHLQEKTWSSCVDLWIGIAVLGVFLMCL